MAVLVLDLRHYRVIRTLQTQRTTVAAAEELGLTQSAVSHQIAEAERRLGRPLTRRVGRRLALNTAGELLAAAAESILREAEYVERNLSAGPDVDRTEIVRIANYAYSSYKWLPWFLKKVQAEFPNLFFEFEANTSKLPVRSVADGEVDIGIEPGTISSPSVHVEPLFADELVGVCHVNHKIASKDYLEAADFLDDPFITYSSIFETGIEEDLFWRPSGIRPRTLLNAGLTDAVIELVRAEFGLTILSRTTVTPFLKDKELTCLKLTKNGLPLQWNALYRLGSPRTDRLEWIVGNLREWCQLRF